MRVDRLTPFLESQEPSEVGQFAAGVLMVAVGSIVWVGGKAHELAKPFIEHGAVAASTKLAENDWISPDAVAPVARGLVVGASLLVLPSVAMAADDVFEVGVAVIDWIVN